MVHDNGNMYESVFDDALVDQFIKELLENLILVVNLKR